MKLLTNLKFVAIVAIFAAVPFAAGAYVEHAAAHGDEDHSEVAQAEENQPSEAPKKYDYTAQPGDSYTQIARKAVQTYGIDHDVNLSPAQIIFAETNLTNASESPLLLVGQKVSLEESAVKEWVDKAQKLTDEQKTAWEAYIAGVDFNTDNVGEER